MQKSLVLVKKSEFTFHATKLQWNTEYFCKESVIRLVPWWKTEKKTAFAVASELPWAFGMWSTIMILEATFFKVGNRVFHNG